jgi:predicted dehydrogenase
MLGADAPGNVMRIASIGTGRMGLGDMKNAMGAGLKANARVVAVCDVDSKRAAHARRTVEDFYKGRKVANDEVKAYTDFRELLERKDIDAVTISTPDHWHALLAIAAAKAGKHIYIQKPFTYTITEGQKLVEAVRANKITLQTGSQQRSSVYFRQVCSIIRNNWMGKLKTIEVGIPTDGGTGKNVPMDVPPNLNYDLWLGPAAMEPYTEHRVHPQQGYGRPGWLQIERYCRGMITGWGAHMYDIAQWGNGSDVDSAPVEITAKGEFPERGLFDVHVGYSGSAKYANGVELTSRNGSAGVKFITEDGWAYCSRGGFKCSNQELLRRQPADGEVKLYESKDHMLDFLSSARAGQDPVCPAEVGHRSNTVCVLHHISMKLGGRTIKWDPKAEKVIGDPEAQSMCGIPFRKPWTL